jgi:MFS family permease
MKNTGRFLALRQRDFRLFWLGQLVSLSGTWMQSVAQSWLVYSLTKSPFYLGLVAAAGSLPILLFTLLGGVAADRFRKRNLLLLTQALSIIPALLLGILTGSNLIAVWQVAVLAAFLGTVNAFDVPARQSYIAELVGKGSLTNAIALNSAAFHGARMVGPVIAGITIATVGLPACFYLNAASFFAVILALSRITAQGDVQGNLNGVMEDFLEGLRYIKGNAQIFRVIILIAVLGLAGMPFITLLPVFAAEIFRGGPQCYGFLVGATGVGSLAAALFLAFSDDRGEKGRFMSFSALSFAVLLLAFSFSRNFYLSVTLLAGIGWSLVSFFAIANSFIQLAVPDNLRGRAMSVYTFVFLGTAPIGNYVLGMTADVMGTTTAVAMTALLCLIASLVFSVKTAGNT